MCRYVSGFRDSLQRKESCLTTIWPGMPKEGFYECTSIVGDGSGCYCLLLSVLEEYTEEVGGSSLHLVSIRMLTKT